MKRENEVNQQAQIKMTKIKGLLNELNIDLATATNSDRKNEVYRQIAEAQGKICILEWVIRQL